MMDGVGFPGVPGGPPAVFVPNLAAEAVAQERESLLCFSPLSVQRVALGLEHSLCVGLRGQQPQLFGWGRNRDNVLGLGHETRERVFPGLAPFFVKQAVFAVAAGNRHSLILIKRPTDAGGKVFSTGLGTEGRLGYPKRGSISATGETEAAAAAAVDEEEEESWFTPTPFRIKFPERARIARIACGAAHSLAVSDCGILYAWGQGSYGALGTGDSSCRYTPVKVNISRTGAFVTQAAAGAKHSMCCLMDGSCWAWGSGASGRLGLGHSRGAMVPAVIESLLQQQIVFVAAGESHSAALDRRGRVYTWGSGAFFRLGHGDEVDSPVPRILESLGGIPIMQIACGTFHTLAISLTGLLFAWGSGLGLGLGFGEDGIGGFCPQPRQVPGVAAPVLQVAAAAYHSAAVTVQGDLLCWGVGGASRLGTGTQDSLPSPKFVPDLRNLVFVSDLRAMLGAQVGDRGGNLQAPAAFTGAAAAAAGSWQIRTIACGGSHTLALTTGGSLWVWGSNEKGQLGVGQEETEDQYEPFLLDCFSLPVKRIACGDNHCLAVTEHGTVLSWGYNEDGQLGLGSTRPAYTPQGISTLRNAIDVFASATYSACITSGIKDANAEAAAFNTPLQQLQQSGELWMWGCAESGKLGLGEKILGGAITVPHSVSIASPVSKLALGQSHVLALTERGLLLVWGAGFYGRLGLGSSANVYSPARVTFPTPLKIRDIAAGSVQSMCLTEDGELWVWGKRESLCAKQHITTPKLFLQLEGPQGVPKVRSIAACGEHCLVVTEDGRVYGWGNNTSFQACCGSRMAEQLDRPEMVDGLPQPAEEIFTGPQHSIAKLRNAELYSWGCTKGGRLGVGWKRKQLQQTPAVVVPNWADPSVSPTAGDGGFDFEAEPQDHQQPMDRIRLDPGVSEASVQSFLSRLAFAAGGNWGGGPSWPQLQELLQLEEFECRPDFLRGLEDGLISVLGRDLDYLLHLGDKEQEMKQLEVQYQTLMIGVATRARCGMASASDNKTPHELQAKLSTLEPLAFFLQQQPAYLLRLLFSVKTKTEKSLVIRITKQVYMELENQRIGGLFCCLMRAVAKREVAEVPDLASCMDPDSSNLIELIRIFALRDLVLAELGNFLLDFKNHNSLVNYLARLQDQPFCYNLDDFIAKNGFNRIEDASRSEQERLRREFHHGFENLKQFLINGIVQTFSQLMLPLPLRRVLLQACQYVYERGFAVEPELLQLGIDFCYGIPTVKLFLNGILEPIFTDPNAFCTKCGFDWLPESISEKLRMIGELFGVLSRETYMDIPSGFLLHQLKFDFWGATSQMLRRQMDVEDDLDVELTMDLFASHYDATEHYVSWNTQDLLLLVNICKKYESYLNLSAHDPIAKIVQAVSGGANPPFSDELIEECGAAQTSLSFRVDHRFLTTEKNLVYCTLTHAPVPQRLAFRQRGEIQDGQRVLAVLIRYVCVDASDFRLHLSDCLRLAPPLTANTPEGLSAEFLSIAEHFASLENPDFVAAALFEKTATSLAKGIMSTEGFSPTDTMRWIAEGLLARKKHKRYLVQLQRHVDAIQTLKRKYDIDLDNRVQTLKEAMAAAETLALEPPIETAAKRFNFQVAFPSLRRKEKDAKDGDFFPSLTFKYSVLQNREIIVRAASSLPPELLVDVYLTITLLPLEGWRVTVTHRTPKVDRQLAQQEFTAEEILVLKSTNPQATFPLAKTPGEPGGLFEVSSLNFVQALQEIRSGA